MMMMMDHGRFTLVPAKQQHASQTASSSSSSSPERVGTLQMVAAIIIIVMICSSSSSVVVVATSCWRCCCCSVLLEEGRESDNCLRFLFLSFFVLLAWLVEYYSLVDYCAAPTTTHGGGTGQFSSDHTVNHTTTDR